ncbi:MAG TPA: RHS repeat-associated core domain-containing protein, partial [Candidatus Limnocylindrales bacterium]|nr:RHS repeat-associated core domain-containing protein [Candidatus Limnocylindrales bacterium]
LDWTASGSSQRFYGTNAHHDVTWLADSTGAVLATLRYDPYGNLVSSTGSSLPDFRFQGSLYDSAVDLSWIVSRWYAPDLGQFISEDSLLGTPADPPGSWRLWSIASGSSWIRDIHRTVQETPLPPVVPYLDGQDDDLPAARPPVGHQAGSQESRRVGG